MTAREEQVQGLEAVDGALKLSAPFLAVEPGRLPGQLTGRLLGFPEPETGRVLDEVRERAPRPWLCPLTPALTAPGGPLEQVLPDIDNVWAVAVTPNGRRVVAGGGRTVRVWDLESGRMEQTVEGHTDYVHAVAVTPDNARVVSSGAFQDHTIRVLDLASGQEIASWTSGPGVGLEPCCTVPTNASLIVYGDSAGGVHVLRLLEAPS